MSDKQLFFPTGFRQDRSRIDGKPYVTIWFEYVNKNTEAFTHVFSSCRNKAHWDDIVNKLDRGLAITFDNLVWKDEKRGLIDADSIPTIEAECDKDELKAILREFKEQQNTATKKANAVKPAGLFGKLFDVEE